MIKINFIGTRPNTDAAFWWESTNPTIVSYRQTVSNDASSLGITTSETISADQLTYTVSYTVNNPETWVAFKNRLSNEIKNYRDNYFTTNNHTLVVIVTNDETGEVLNTINVIN